MNLRPREAAKELGIGLTKLWSLAKTDPTFPSAIKLGARTTVFRREDLQGWMAARAASVTNNDLEQTRTDGARVEGNKQ